MAILTLVKGRWGGHTRPVARIRAWPVAEFARIRVVPEQCGAAPDGVVGAMPTALRGHVLTAHPCPRKAVGMAPDMIRRLAPQYSGTTRIRAWVGAAPRILANSATLIPTNAWRTLLTVLALICLSSAGCVGLGDLVPTTDGPPTGKPCQVITDWNDQVVFTPDPTHGGAPTPGLACRLYLFGERIDFPMACAGKVTVDIYDVSDPGKETQPKLLEVLYIDKDTLHRLLRRDMIGWGYTLFLPWGTYNPQIKCVQLKLRYEPVNGTPLFTASKKLTLRDPADTGLLPVKSSSRLINQAAEVRQ